MHFTINFMPYLILTLLKIEFFNLHLKSQQSETLVVYHVHGTTSPLTVWANGTQKFRTGKFRPGIAAFTFLYNSFPFIKKQLRRPESGIKDGLKKWNTNFPFGTFRPGTMKNRTTFPRSTGTTQKVVFHLLFRALIFSKLFVNGTETTTV